MADNVQTAAEWGQVIDNLDLTKKSVLTQLSGVNANIQTYNNQLLSLSAQLSAADLAGDTGLMAVIQSQIDTLNSRIAGANLAAANLTRDIAQIDADLNNAFAQQSVAEAGPPLDNSTTVPASSLPGDPTDVTLADQPSTLTAKTAITDGQNPNITDQTRANAAAFIANNYPSNVDPYVLDGVSTIDPVLDTNSTVDDGSDPYVSNGVSTIEPVDQLPIDDGSDPYVSNGESTIAPVEQLIVDDGSDPYVSNGQSTIAPADITPPPQSNVGLTAAKLNTNSQATQQDVNNSQQERDWRVVLSLAPGANYLYKNKGNEGILLPLVATNGVLFPYTPQVSVTYAANYDPTELVHSNYKIYQYKGSSVDQISITCDFTAQDTFEANYLLAVIHFFRSATKMFYGKDKKPNIGSPPPLCYLNGLGTFQFNNHPLVITSFNYSLPSDVDYIRATNTTTNAGVNKSPENVPDNSISLAAARILAAGLSPKSPAFQKTPAGSLEPTYVPTKMQIQISAVPVVARNDISNRFSLTDYATGNLLRGRQNSTGGIW